MRLYKKEDVPRIFDEEKILIGNKDVVPEYRAVEIFGKEAVEFAKRLKDGNVNHNGFGIGNYTLDYLYLSGFNIAATYANICNIREMIAQEGGVAHA